jgi:hypothetical protein
LNAKTRVTEITKGRLWSLIAITSILVVLIFFCILSLPISLDLTYVPTVMNGIAAVVAILLGFTATGVALKRSYEQQDTDSHIWGLLFLIFPILFLFIGYGALLFNSDFIAAVRLALISFGLAIVMFYVVLFSIMRKYV